MSLYQRYLDYLNQAMPDISGIFSVAPSTTAATTTTTALPTTPSAGLTAEQLALLYPQNQGGDGQESTGFGRFGNLDPDDYRDIMINNEIVRTYRNINSGLYQDIEGKNVQNLGIRPPSIMEGILKTIGFNNTTQYPGYFSPETLYAPDFKSQRGGIFDFFKNQRLDAIKELERRSEETNIPPSMRGKISTPITIQDNKPSDDGRRDSGPDYSNVSTGGGSPAQRSKDENRSGGVTTGAGRNPWGR